MAKSKKPAVDRRNFLRGAVGGAAALAVNTGTAQAQRSEPERRSATPILAKETDPSPLSGAEVLTEGRSGSDYMVDVIKSLGFEYVCANPGSSFRALHESLINYGGNKPELITCCHEESSVAMAHGYSKIEGKPACVFAHGTVGLQHASMAIYNAFCDRAPVYIIIGNTIDATMRRPGAEWDHSVQDAVAMVRDYVKWDDLPISLPHFGESAVRAYKIAMTPPALPVVVVADSDLQERPAPESERLHVPKLTLAAPPQGDSGAVAEAAQLLVVAESPVLIADRAARTPAGLKLLIELAQILQAPVVNQMGRMNFPTRHPLNQTERSRAVLANADVILGLEAGDFWGTVNSMRDQVNRTTRSIAKPGAKLITITAGDLYTKSNYQDFQRYPEVDIAIAADAEATLPSLIEACERLITTDRKRAFEERGKKLAAAQQEALEKARTEATYGWDASPISTARLYTELWAQIKDQDWSLASDAAHSSGWPLRLWNFDKHYQYIGGSGGAGIGYGAPAAHHRIPLLSLMHNNRAYHMEMMHLQRMANRHQRGIDRTGIGVTLDDPNIDYAMIARGMGVHAEGPIADPKDLGPAIGRALDVVRRGEPALIDVVTQPR
jgi:thiamine pyrophosphate-dependent acetolactate synthase large subunit-like protein